MIDLSPWLGMCLQLDRCTPMYALENVGGHLPTHDSAEKGGWHHLPGFGDLDHTGFITGVDSLHSNKQTH